MREKYLPKLFKVIASSIIILSVGVAAQAASHGPGNSVTATSCGGVGWQGTC